MVIVVGALIFLAAIAAFMGWLPLTPKNDLLRSLQRLGSLSPTYAHFARLQSVLSFQNGEAPAEMAQADLTVCKALDQRLRP